MDASIGASFKEYTMFKLIASIAALTFITACSTPSTLSGSSADGRPHGTTTLGSSPGSNTLGSYPGADTIYRPSAI